MINKKELKNAYKSKKFQRGVYQIKNNQNGKIFIAGSTDLVAIWNRAKFQLNMGSYPVKELQKDWTTQGEDNFTYEILEEIEEKENVPVNIEKEIKTALELYLEELKPFGEKGYNKKQS